LGSACNLDTTPFDHSSCWEFFLPDDGPDQTSIANYTYSEIFTFSLSLAEAYERPRKKVERQLQYYGYVTPIWGDRLIFTTGESPMSRFKMDLCDIRQAALAWQASRSLPVSEFRDYVVQFARDNGYDVTSTVLDDEFVEIRLSTAEIIRFSAVELSPPGGSLILARGEREETGLGRVGRSTR
jgi:hypothetical protein